MDEKEKQVQIYHKTFIGLLLVTEDLLNGNDIEIETIEKLNKELYNKLDAMIKRDLYTKSKTAPTEEEREKARLEYLEKAGINQNFRW